MPDDPDLFDRIIAEEPPEATAFIKVFANSPAPAPWVVRLLHKHELQAVAAHIGTLGSDEAKAAAYISEKFVRGALVSIDGVRLPDDLDYRRRLVGALTEPRLVPLYEAYQALDAAELAAQRAVLDAPFPPGADSGPPSGASGTAPGAASPLPASPATTAAPSPD